MAPETATRLRALPKGDALDDGAARRDHGREADADLIPLCHPLAAFARRRRRSSSATAQVEITAAAETSAQTGVEMEALTAASVAALTVYDMAKAIDKQMTFSVELRREDQVVNAAVLTVSDRVSRGEAEDASGDLLEQLAARPTATRSSRRVVARRGRRDRRRDRGARRERRRSC